MLQAFDRLSERHKMMELIEKIAARLPDAIKNSDQDLLRLYRGFDQLGVLQMPQYEHLVHFLQQYSATKFQTMDVDVALDFADFFLKIGLWHWDQNLMEQIEGLFMASYVQYDVKKMCRLVKLAGCNFMRS